MWHTTRTDGLDDPNHTKRGPLLNVTDMIGGSLRWGFILQLVSLTLYNIIYWYNGGSGLMTTDFKYMLPEDRENSSFLVMLVFLAGIYMLGSLSLMCFQIYAADDTCWARGYRSGSKIMRLATFLDVLSSTFSFLFALYMAKHYSTKWYTHFISGGSEWLFFVFTRLLHGWSLLGYSLATYLLEVYHDEGAGDTHGYVNGILFFCAAISELSIFFGYASRASPALLWIALAAASLWAIFFEPEVNYVSPALHETELTNEVEQQVECFARITPQYPNLNPQMRQPHGMPGQMYEHLPK